MKKKCGEELDKISFILQKSAYMIFQYLTEEIYGIIGTTM